MSDQSYDASLDLLRRLNPSNIKANLSHLIKLNPELSEDLLSSIDIPLSIQQDSKQNRKYLCCDYNRDLDSFRSPWSNVYYPQLPTSDEEESYVPAGQLRELETALNEAFDTYRDLYYDGGVSSVYLWNDDDKLESGFSGVVLLKKTNEEDSWDSIHVFECEVSGAKAEYKLTSTVILSLNEQGDGVNMNGNLVRQNSKTAPVVDGLTGHIVNIGSFIEDVESQLRNLLQQVYFDKNKDIVAELRSLVDLKKVSKDKLKQKELINALQ
ncbi:hypothetical protein WICPIJ_000202 [Wickerhamomyces pijperi]|uniref:F-actin-capping protein subunit beta n=1 Tax=Wickerhamomyces pijperi TaxID=599730 RepID=A0A9P8TR27_WICPI|nr:hypothetical protein WICPIJ_000202 [Wickerhamomyces pijperi]